MSDEKTYEAATALVPQLEEQPEGDSEIADALGPSTSPDDDRNWALDEDTRQYVMEHIYPLLDHCRYQMVSQKEEWKAIRRMLSLSHDDGQRYLGRSNAYIPIWARARKTLVSTLSQSLFPSDEYLDVTDKEKPHDAGSDNAKAVKTYIQWEFEKNAKVREQIKPFLGDLVDNGVAIGKYWYEAPSSGGKKAPDLQQLMTFDQYKTCAPREGLRFSPRSIFDWYVFPININDLSEATLIFEDLDVPRSYIKERARKQEWENTDIALEAPEVPDHNLNLQDNNVEAIGNPASTQPMGNSDIGGIRTVTEIWCNAVLPNPAYMENEVPGTPIPCKIVMAGDVLLQVVRNPFWTQAPPYLAARDLPTPGQFFPKGTGHLARALQYLVNDFTNQLNDNGTYAMNPVAIVNPGLLAGALTPLKPGAVWPTTDVNNGIKFDRPPIEQIQYGMNLVSTYSGMMADLTGATPSLQGQAGGKNSKTATGMQILQKNASTPLKDLVEDIENSVLNPLMFACWVLAQQYRAPEFMAEVMSLDPATGLDQLKAIKLKKADLLGNFTLRWLASSQAANQAQRAGQVIQMLQILPPLMPLLQQAGYAVNPAVPLKRLYADGYGMRGFDQFIFKMAPQPMMPGAPGQDPNAMPQPGQGAPGMPNPNNMQSATLQGGAPPEGADQMAGGEGDVLAQLRDSIDQETAQQGQFNTPNGENE